MLRGRGPPTRLAPLRVWLSLTRILSGRVTAGIGKFALATGVAEARPAAPASVDEAPVPDDSAFEAFTAALGSVDVALEGTGLPGPFPGLTLEGTGLSREAVPTASAALMRLAPAPVVGVALSLVELMEGLGVAATGLAVAGEGDEGADSDARGNWELVVPPGGVKAGLDAGAAADDPPGAVAPPPEAVDGAVGVIDTAAGAVDGEVGAIDTGVGGVDGAVGVTDTAVGAVDTGLSVVEEGAAPLEAGVVARVVADVDADPPGVDVRV